MGADPRAVRRRLFRILLGLFLVGGFVFTVEIGLRTYKSLTYDGMLFLGPSANNVRSDTYGWISPSDRAYQKSDSCYGRGVVTYNENGFRGPPLSEAEDAAKVVCLLGDSTLQSYQIPDGTHLGSMLRTSLKKRFGNVFLLQLAVGGYGTTQEWMLYRDYCAPLNPDLIVHHWADNDPANNDFEAELYGHGSNMRRRPFWENGQIVYRKPFTLKPGAWLESLMIVKIANLALESSSPSETAYRAALERGWSVAGEMLQKIGAGGSPVVGLVASDHERAFELYRQHGYSVATYEPFTEEETCGPRDPHPHSGGHAKMHAALWPVVERALVESGHAPQQ